MACPISSSKCSCHLSGDSTTPSRVINKPAMTFLMLNTPLMLISYRDISYFSSFAQWNKGSLIKCNRFRTPTQEERLRAPLETDLRPSQGIGVARSQGRAPGLLFVPFGLPQG